MTNPFKELDDLEESIKAPTSIKNKVMGSYGFIVNIAKVVEFIVGSLTNVCTGMLNLLDEKPPSAASKQNQIMGFSSYKEDEDEEPPSWDDDFGDDFGLNDTGNQNTDDKDFN